MKLSSDKQVHLNSYLKEFLSIAPIAHALPRALEAKLISRVEIRSPSLDIGCGDGTFVKVLLQNSKRSFDVGIDISEQELFFARKKRVYRSHWVANATELPFEDDIFRTILCNSVLEHINELDHVLSEISRVLTHDGEFVFTVPLRSCSDFFFYSNLLSRIGLRKFADLYSGMKHKLWRHVNLLTPDEWCHKLERAGMTVSAQETFNGEAAVSICDLFGPLAWFPLLMKRWFHKTVIFRPRLITSLLSQILMKYYQHDGKPGGALFVIAHKKSKALNLLKIPIEGQNG